MSGVYKMVEIQSNGGSIPKIKTSPDKPSYPGKKQVYRFLSDGFLKKDLIAFESEPSPKDGVPLLIDVIKSGKLIQELPPIEQSRKFAIQSITQLPEGLHDLYQPAKYEVVISNKITDLHKQIAAKVGAH